ncbi:MAG: Unknown protein [uncultured Sulfurovum sp.]|uniref:Uncharacterized protein n=1 Tax=uncultured Sulfurovum sp. TaxID=269237 RepID=A0A6S6SZN0_9BACT|nr:MAG: Unknown protein [uncultured Sulfurovum sp.]
MEHLKPNFIPDLEHILSSHTVLMDVKKNLHTLFAKTPYGCEKDYPVAIVHETMRIKEECVLEYFKKNHLLGEEGLTYGDYPRSDLERLSLHAPKYIQNVGFMLSTTKDMPEPTFFNKFKHDYWKKITSSEGLEAVIDISTLTPSTSKCEAEDALRAIIRKRKEVHQLKKIAFVWIVEIKGENTQIAPVMQHYFEDETMIVKNAGKTFYVGWSAPLQDINMRYFVCPPE